MTDPTSRQRGRLTETRHQLSDKNLRTESNIWSEVPEWARYLDILTDWLTVSCNVASTSTVPKKHGQQCKVITLRKFLFRRGLFLHYHKGTYNSHKQVKTHLKYLLYAVWCWPIATETRNGKHLLIALPKLVTHNGLLLLIYVLRGVKAEDVSNKDFGDHSCAILTHTRLSACGMWHVALTAPCVHYWVNKVCKDIEANQNLAEPKNTSELGKYQSFIANTRCRARCRRRGLQL
jgi:hypothetical protein